MSDVAATLSTRAATGGDRLADLRARIAQVTRRRSRLRLLSGLSRLTLTVLIALAVVFLVDWIVSPGRLVRGLVIAGAAAAVARVCWKRVRPGLAQRESEMDIALAIEKRQGIDSDLVAALEFAAANRARSGSADLRDAVIDYVADFSRSWEMPREAADPKLRRPAAWLAAALAGIVIAVGMRPDFAAAFLNRLLLGSAHYPTRTRIESLAIGGTSVDVKPGAQAEVKSHLGRAVGFTVGVGGEQPRLVRMRLMSSTTGDTTEIELLPEIATPAGEPGSAAAAAAPSSVTFTARLPKLAESVLAQVLAGDAWTDPVRVIAIKPPLIDLAITVTPPAYAAGASDRPAVGARQVTVPEGSEIGIAVRCTNKKLASAMLVVDGTEHPLRPTGSAAGGLAADWEIAVADSPLGRLDKTVAFELRVVDQDGLGADLPLVGSIRVRPDAPPRVTADVQTRLVLPTAAPRLAWRVADEHAVASVVVVAEAVTAAAGSGSQAGERPRTLTIPAPLPAGTAGWVGREQLPLEGTLPVKLDPLALEVGDQVRLTVRATDYRGGTAGREAQSEPIVLDVTDERGILAALTETDERSIEQIDAIIDRELTVGGGK